MDRDKQKIELQISTVERKINELKSRWPFHSVQPRMVAELEELEEERERLQSLLSQNKFD